MLALPCQGSYWARQGWNSETVRCWFLRVQYSNESLDETYLSEDNNRSGLHGAGRAPLGSQEQRRQQQNPGVQTLIQIGRTV